jgi:hypothetical protein
MAPVGHSLIVPVACRATTRDGVFRTGCLTPSPPPWTAAGGREHPTPMTAIPRILFLSICLLGSIAAVVLAATAPPGGTAPTALAGAAPAAVGDPPAAPRAFRAKHVIILVIDGPRWTETWGEPARQYIPQRATVLAPQGVLCSDFANDGPTYTDAGHSALVTGFYQEINNTGLELPRNPSLFQRWVKTGAPATDAWVITSKDKLQILTDSAAEGWKHAFLCSFDCGKGGKGVGSGYREDTETWERVQALLAQHHPHAVLINFKMPDAAGHAKDWNGYLQGIRDTDVYAGKLWQMLEADPEFAGQTDLFITNDHGRHLDGHKDGFVSHGDDCPGCHKIELLAMGPDFKRGAVSARHRGQIDVAVTAAAILGLTIPGSSGQVMEELFSTAPAKAAP